MIKRSIWLFTVVGTMLLACAGVVLAQSDATPVASESAKPHTQSAPSQGAQSRVIPENYIVVLEDTVGGSAQATEQVRPHPTRVASEMARENGLGVSHVYDAALKGFAAKIPDHKLDEVRSDPRVEFVVPDHEVQLFAQTMPTGINRVDADLSSTAAGSGNGSVDVDIAIIDTGIYKHSDLRVVGGYNCTSTNRNAWGDGHGHGTHVAGSAAAKDDAAGVVGTAPGARLWAMKALNDRGSGRLSWEICAIDRITKMNTDANAANDIEVVNMSLGGEVGPGADDGNCGRTNNDPEHQAICRSVKAGATYVVAAGNEGDRVSKYTPAAYDEVITVSALADYNGEPNGGAPKNCSTNERAKDDDIAFFSNYGSDIDLAAPGVCIRSTFKDGGFRTWDGTSMASPHVAGAAALYKANNPSKTPTGVRSFLTSAANTEAKGAGHIDSIGLNPEPVLQMDNY